MQLDNPALTAIYFASITAIVSVITNLVITIISNIFQNSREKRSEIQDIYAGCIKSIATVSTLSGATESNMDNIEQSLVEAKKYFALLLIRTKNKSQIKQMEEEIYLFITGQYTQLLEKVSIEGLQPSEKYKYLENIQQKVVLSAADIMLKRIIKIAPQDKRLSL
ncbi:hypothetical protein HCG51_21380 [Tolypothrix sp. PCC 7910]|uniref:hypothetical protein n=1 Tax=Tolypothrix sp. PCC 7910 TaxID=2099387 RepID=UPI0014276FFD|nr:hypothetical protein [Tolypothrix sp. PCC 7910]QIR39003.1 hypothetical protein HCG51_21380 [Tolypothrix sp. PCC 7910]